MVIHFLQTQSPEIQLMVCNISGNNNSLTNNIVTGNSGLGISVTGGTGNQLTNNTVGTNSFRWYFYN